MSKHRRMLLSGLFLLPVALLRCALEEPRPPLWESVFTLPVADRRFTVADLVKGEVSVFRYEDGLLGFRVEGELEQVTMSDRLRLEPVDRVMDVHVPDMTISRLSADKVDFSFASLTEQAVSAGEERVIAAFSFANVPGQLQPENNLESIQVIEGAARLTFRNRLPIELQDVVFRFVDPAEGKVVFITTAVRRLLPGQKDSLDLPVVQKRYERGGTWYISGRSAGSGGRAVRIAADQGVDLSVELVDFHASTVQVRRQSFYMEDRQTIALDYDAAVQEAAFSSGTLELNIENELDLDLDLEITSEEIRVPRSGEPLVINARAAAHGSRRVSVPLSGHLLRLGSQPVKPPAVHFLIVCLGSCPDQRVVTVSEHEAVRIRAYVRDGTFAAVSGILDHYSTAVEPTEQTVDLPDGLDRFAGLNVSAGRLCLEFTNAVELPVSIAASLIGFGEDGRRVDLPLTVDLGKGSVNQPRVTPVILQAPEHPQLAALLNLKPRRIRLEGTAVVGDGRTVGTVSRNSYIKARYVLETPAELAWNDGVPMTDSAVVVIQPGVPERPNGNGVYYLSASQMQRVRAITLATEIENHLPVSGDVEFRLIDRSNGESEVISAPLAISAAPTDNAGRTISARRFTKTIDLSEQEVAKFTQSGDQMRTLIVGASFRVRGTGDRRVKLFDGDYAAFRAVIEAKVLLGGP